jgi:type II secretory pathway pseudopilin PulG
MKTRQAILKVHRSGAVLLEVVIALVLFVVAASFITAGMNSSVDTVERLRLNTHAVNLASSVLAELQMGARSTETNGPANFDPPFEKWNWQIQYEPAQGEIGDTNPLTRVEVIVRHSEQPIVYRLTQILPLEEKKKGPNATLTF